MDPKPSHPPVVVTGRPIEQSVDDTELDERLDGDVRHGTGHRERPVIEWSDPRLPAVKVSTFDYVEYAVLFSRPSSSPTSGGVTTWRGVICSGSPPSVPPTF